MPLMEIKTPKDITELIKKLNISDQIKIQRYIAKLKALIEHDYDKDHINGENCASMCSHHDHKHDKEDPDIEMSLTNAPLPEWKKKVLNMSSNDAPFGGSWHSESNISVTNNKT